MRSTPPSRPGKPGFPLLVESTRRFPSQESYTTWLFEFLNVDFKTITPGQELDWRRDAKQFVWGSAVVIAHSGQDERPFRRL